MKVSLIVLAAPLFTLISTSTNSSKTDCFRIIGTDIRANESKLLVNAAIQRFLLCEGHEEAPEGW